jgi:hypothetical protein
LRINLGLLAAGLAVAAHAAPPDKAKVSEARSLSAEAAAVETAHARDRVTDAYARGLLASLRKDLQQLTRDPALGPLAAGAVAAIDRHDIPRLVAVRDRLVALERSLGRAA